MFEINDKVRVVKQRKTKNYEDTCGKEGFVVYIDYQSNKYGVDFPDIKNPASNYGRYYFEEGELKLVESKIPTLDDIAARGLTCVIHTPSKEDAICVVGKIPSKSCHVTSNNWLEHWDKHEENTCYYIVDGAIDSYSKKSYFENNSDYRSGIPYTIYEFSDLFATGGVVPYLDLSMFKEKNKEEKKMLTVTITEGTRVDKSCNGTIPTMTTNIELLSGNVFDKVTTVKGSATCDKADYDERQGVLEALANAICGGNFYKAYAEAVKLNRCEDELSRTCIYCGKVLNTVEEKQEHEAWHVERRKARHERYLLRKRAKEIAFEEQAQKMAKEIIAEDNKK